MAVRALLVWLLLAAAPACAAGQCVVVRGERSAFAIYRDEAAPGSVRRAASELQLYVRKATGVELPVAAEPKSPMICLGDTPAARAAGFSVEGLELEGFRIATRNGNVYIHGPDTPDGERTPGGGRSNGTLFGVYAFLERYVGVRWLMPGPVGEHVPARDELVLTDLSLTEAPSFLRRQLPYVQNRRPEVKTWALRNRIGESLALSHGHNWRRAVPASLFDEHPEYFAKHGGKPVPPVGRYKLCTTCPGLVDAYAQAALDAFDAHPNRTVYSLSPSDGGGWCECERCTALNETDPFGKTSRTRGILTFYNGVARLVRQRRPDRIVCGYVYASYLFPPSDRSMRLEPNLFLVWAPSMDYGFTLFRPELRAQWERCMAGWSAMTKNIGYYDLPVTLSQDAGAPNPPGVNILKFLFPRIKRSGAKSVYIYGRSAWGHAGLQNYILAKLLWNADADVDALLDEFCDCAYGRGSPEMKQIYRLLDAAMEEHYRKDMAARYQLTPTILKAVYAANFAAIERLHQQALAKAESPQVRKRLEVFGDNLKALCFHLDAYGLMANASASRYYLDADGFSEFMSDRMGSLWLEEARRRVRRRRIEPLEVTRFAGEVGVAEPMRRYRLRGDQNILLFAPEAGPVQLRFLALVPRGKLIRYSIVDREGKSLAAGAARAGSEVTIEAAAGQYYVLCMTAGSGWYEIGSTVPMAVDGSTGERGLHFLGKATPLYFHVPAGTESFTLTVSSDGPGETALAKVYEPTGRLAATFDTSRTMVDRQTVPVGPDGAGFWKIVCGPAERGAFDDVYIIPGRRLSGFFSLSPEGTLVVRRLSSPKP